jgi:hypothetical protein
MMRSLLFGATFLFAVARVASAQSSGEPNLAEIARQAEAAKATIPKAKKSYTNADLNNGGLPPAPVAPASGFMSASQGKLVPAEEMLKLSQAKDAADQAQKRPESFWVGQANRIRQTVDQLAQSLAQLKTLPKNPNAAAQKATDDQIAMLQGQFERAKKRWAGLEDDARTAKINMAWLSPPPKFPE